MSLQERYEIFKYGKVTYERKNGSEETIHSKKTTLNNLFKSQQFGRYLFTEQENEQEYDFKPFHKESIICFNVSNLTKSQAEIIHYYDYIEVLENRIESLFKKILEYRHKQRLFKHLNFEYVEGDNIFEIVRVSDINKQSKKFTGFTFFTKEPDEYYIGREIDTYLDFKSVESKYTKTKYYMTLKYFIQYKDGEQVQPITVLKYIQLIETVYEYVMNIYYNITNIIKSGSNINIQRQFEHIGFPKLPLPEKIYDTPFVLSTQDTGQHPRLDSGPAAAADNGSTDGTNAVAENGNATKLNKIEGIDSKIGILSDEVYIYTRDLLSHFLSNGTIKKDTFPKLTYEKIKYLTLKYLKEEVYGKQFIPNNKEWIDGIKYKIEKNKQGNKKTFYVPLDQLFTYSSPTLFNTFESIKDDFKFVIQREENHFVPVETEENKIINGNIILYYKPIALMIEKCKFGKDKIKFTDFFVRKCIEEFNESTNSEIKKIINKNKKEFINILINLQVDKRTSNHNKILNDSIPFYKEINKKITPRPRTPRPRTPRPGTPGTGTPGTGTPRRIMSRGGKMKIRTKKVSKIRIKKPHTFRKKYKNGNQKKNRTRNKK